MSIRKIYDVLVNGDSVYSGSYKTALVVYESFVKSFDLLDDSVPVPSVTISFKPLLSKGEGTCV